MLEYGICAGYGFPSTRTEMVCIWHVVGYCCTHGIILSGFRLGVWRTNLKFTLTCLSCFVITVKFYQGLDNEVRNSCGLGIERRANKNYMCLESAR